MDAASFKPFIEICSHPSQRQVAILGVRVELHGPRRSRKPSVPCPHALCPAQRGLCGRAPLSPISVLGRRTAQDPGRPCQAPAGLWQALVGLHTPPAGFWQSSRGRRRPPEESDGFLLKIQLKSNGEREGGIQRTLTISLNRV